MSASRWLVPIRQPGDAQLQMICFPCGGGAASSFHAWRDYDLPVAIYAVQLPGRETRIAEPYIENANELVAALRAEIKPLLNRPTIFYGHSMGAGLAFQLTHELSEAGAPLPVHMIAVGRQPPHYPYPNPIDALDDDALIEFMQNMGGIPVALSKHPAFLQQYLPKIRADYRLNSSIAMLPQQSRSVPVTLINGVDDQLVPSENADCWAQHTAYPVADHALPGGHFFMYEHPEAFAETLCRVVNKML